MLRHALLPYTVRHYHPRWPETARPVKHWKQRLAEAQEAGKPISTIGDHCLMTATVQNVVRRETISTTSDIARDTQEMKPSTRFNARYVAFRLLQRVPSGNPYSSVLTVDVPLLRSKNVKTLMYTSARASVVHTETNMI